MKIRHIDVARRCFERRAICNFEVKEVINVDAKFALKTRVTSYDVGPTRTLKPSSVLKMMQETAGMHLAQDGLTYEYMRSSGIVFLLVKLAVAVKRMPRCEENIKIETWFERTEGVKFVRDMRFLSEASELLLEADTRWIIADPNNHRILRPSAFPFEMPEVGGDTVKISVSRIVVPDGAVNAGSRLVRWSDIDCNNHMNNAVYADIICDFYPQGLGFNELGSFQINFDGEASLGDEISIKTAADARGGAVISGTVSGRRCFTSHLAVGTSGDGQVAVKY